MKSLSIILAVTEEADYLRETAEAEGIRYLCLRGLRRGGRTACRDADTVSSKGGGCAAAYRRHSDLSC